MFASVEALHAELTRLCADVRARCQWRPVDWEIARWQVSDRLPLIAVRLVSVAHLLRRHEAHTVAVAGWHAWLAMLGEGLLRAVDGRSLLLAWAPASGRAPPAGPQLVQRQ
jgi:hypothetical protein